MSRRAPRPPVARPRNETPSATAGAADRALAGLVGDLAGWAQRPGEGRRLAPSANGDLDNHRIATGIEISSSTVAKLGGGWTMPLTASSIYGTFAANPVTDGRSVSTSSRAAAHC
jgi:hypothetical protein